MAMAIQEHLDILKQGVEAWNQWRKEHSEIQPDLNRADLQGTNLIGIDLSRATLIGTDLNRANLSDADLKGADLSLANLQGANLSRSGLRGVRFMATSLIDADLSSTNLWDAYLGNSSVGYADLSGANLSHAQLGGLDMSYANLSGAKLNGADLGGVNLSNANLTGVDFTGVIMAGTALGDRDLRVVKGLEAVQHRSPSPISINTIYRSEGQIPEDFLRKAGVPDSFITYMRSLVVKPIDYYTCFISYSSKDQVFAERLYTDLQQKGVRCWFALENMKIGDEIRTRIDESIRLYDKLLLVLSEHSITSTWVKNEVEAAFEKEEQQDTQVLFPIALDDTVKHTTQAWAATIRRRKHIGDFTRWKQHDDYQQAFEQLLRDLKAEA
jgi:uncharacterized protein YjbI with pentapeptide repeats